MQGVCIGGGREGARGCKGRKGGCIGRCLRRTAGCSPCSPIFTHACKPTRPQVLGPVLDELMRLRKTSALRNSKRRRVTPEQRLEDMLW